VNVTGNDTPSSLISACEAFTITKEKSPWPVLGGAVWTVPGTAVHSAPEEDPRKVFIGGKWAVGVRILAMYRVNQNYGL
jgi:hypothetical protein